MSKKPYLLRRSLLSASISTALGALALSSISNGAIAQEDSLEEVVITGSRIVRRDYQSNSPIVTVDQGDFEQQTGLNIEGYLNQLPTYNPASSPVTTQQDVQITPINSVGIASISLRGFGPNRSLVLVDGKRPTPINALMVTDINAIPSALIQRVETITGGASAVYGADAVGGVTNFILRDDFEGFELDTQYGVTEAGDGDEYRMSAVLGTNFADGRGNVTLGVEHYNREVALQRERDIYTDRWAANDTAGSFLFLQGINGYSCNFDCPPQPVVDAIYGGQSPYSPNAASAFFRGYNFNPDGSIFVSGSQIGEARYRGPIDGRSYAQVTSLDATDPTGNTTYGALKWNNTQAFVSAPQERYSFFASGSFDVTDTVSVYTRANFAESKTRTLLFGTNAIGGWSALVPYDPAVDSPVDTSGQDLTDPATVQDIINNPGNYANPGFIGTGQPGAQHPVPVELAIMLNSRTNLLGAPGAASAEWQPNWNPDFSLPPRNTENTNNVWQIETGIEFELPGDWTGEAYYSHGESSTYNVAGGNLSLERYRAVVRAPDYGRGAELTGNIEGSTNEGFGAGDVTCTSGFYDTFFGGDQPLTEDCFNAVNATLQTRTQNTQDIIELNVQGSLFELPAGALQVAGGYQKRRNSAQFYPDILQSQDSFTDQVVGVYPTGYLDASTSVDDYYVEALVPVFSDLPGIQQLDLELGARFSDYSETDEQTTWKALANWQINDWARVRGGFNRATRAPNIGELFLNPQEVFTGGGNFSDACGIRSNAPYGAQGAVDSNGNPLTDPQVDPNEPPIGLAPGQTQEGANSTYLICQALMGGAGSEGASQFYTQDATVPGGGGGFAWVLQEGNPNLESETADTWTLGAVVNSPWENPWLSGLTASIDYYNVEIEDAIMLYSLDYAAFRCFGSNIVSTPAEAQAQADSLGCQLTPRSPSTGAALNTSLSYDNQARIETSGFDVGLNWFGDLQELVSLPGSLSVSLQATILDEYRTKQSPAAYDVWTEWKGSLGPNLSGTNGGAYDYRLFGSLTYMKDSWSVSLRWRHLPEVNSIDYANQKAIIANNARVAGGGEGLILGYNPAPAAPSNGVLTEIPADSYNIFDLAFNWNINETLTLRGGITNLFDADPEEVGSTTGLPPGSNLNVCGDAPGCQNPGGYNMPRRGGYNAGYYDTLGRRWFMGLKATF